MKIICGYLFAGLQVLEDVLSIGDLVGIGLGVLDEGSLHKDLLDLHVVQHTNISPRTFSKAAMASPCAAHTHATGEESSSIRNELDLLEVTGVERVRGVSGLFR